MRHRYDCSCPLCERETEAIMKVYGQRPPPEPAPPEVIIAIQAGGTVRIDWLKHSAMWCLTVETDNGESTVIVTATEAAAITLALRPTLSAATTADDKRDAKELQGLLADRDPR